MRPERLFAYGTLLDKSVQHEVFGRTLPSVADCLRGYAKTSIILDGERFPIIIPDHRAQLEGAVLELSTEELAQADEYETEAYARRQVALASGTTAWIYLAPDRSHGRWR